MAKPSRRLIHSHDGAEDLLFRGNAELAAGQPDRALHLYTRVLYKTCPGHVCAFLNRSLAYISLGYPELAVMDAYRAAFVCNRTRYSPYQSPRDRELCSTIAQYLRSEELHLKADEPWTSRPASRTGPRWLSTKLADIFISPMIDAEQQEQKTIPWDALETRAIYRMCGALWQCGLGARADALGMIDDMILASAGHVYELTEDELESFHVLGDEILEDCMKDLSTDNELTQSLMRCKLTWAHRVVYPWNKHVPDTNTSYKDAEELEIFADSAAPSCTVRLKPETPKSGAALKLVAARDIDHNNVVLSEESLLQVSTADSVLTQSFICDSCATVMITSGEAQPQTARQKPQSWASSGASVGSTIPNSPATYAAFFEQQAKEQGLPLSVEDCYDFAQAKEEYPLYSPAPSRPSTPPSRPSTPLPHGKPREQGKLDLTPDFFHCNVCLAATFCCDDCFGFSSDYHLKLCNTGVEAHIRSAYHGQAQIFDPNSFTRVDNRLLIRPENRCLYDLLFVRILSMAVDKDVNALDLPEIRWLNGDLRTAPPSKETLATISNLDPALLPGKATPESVGHSKVLPWTFTNNVLLPIFYLKMLDIDPVTHLDKTDGWVINTLYAKIMHSTRITKGVRHSRTYDEGGKLVREETFAPEPVDHDMWIGSIHPVFSMISVIDDDEDRVPNVVMREGRSVKCFATSSGDQFPQQTDRNVLTGVDDELRTLHQSRPCIKAGDPILRSTTTKSSSITSPSHGDDSLASWIGDVQDMSLDVVGKDAGSHRRATEHGKESLGDCEMDTTS
ncbi:hypothetical protein MMC13_003279 [Lambiella insularis]|nr:hypothetical protein [Lambiella insularis]